MTQNIWGFPSNQSTTFNEALGYKKYVALLTQTGTDNPVATVLENTLGSDINWIRFGIGIYYGENINFIDPNKVFISMTGNKSQQGNGNISSVSGEIYNDGPGNAFWFSTENIGSGSFDGWGTYISVEIRVYP